MDRNSLIAKYGHLANSQDAARYGITGAERLGMDPNQIRNNFIAMDQYNKDKMLPQVPSNGQPAPRGQAIREDTFMDRLMSRTSSKAITPELAAQIRSVKGGAGKIESNFFAELGAQWNKLPGLGKAGVIGGGIFLAANMMGRRSNRDRYSPY